MEKTKRVTLLFSFVLAMLLGIVAFAWPAFADESGQEAQAESAGIQYVYVESSVIQGAGVENVVISLGDEAQGVTEAYLVVDGPLGIQELPLVQNQEGALLFSDSFSENQLGVYSLYGIRYVLNGEEFELVFSELEIDASFEVRDEASESASSEEAQEGVIQIEDDDVESGSAAESVEEGVATVASSVTSMMSGRSGGDLIVVLDPGHGGRDSGAVGYGLEEATLNLKIAKYAKAELEKYEGVTVYMTRTSDKDLCGGSSFVERNDLKARVDFAKEHDADVLVSFHLNSYNGSAYGAEIYYPNKTNDKDGTSAEGKDLAEQIQKQLTSLGLYDRGVKSTSDEYYVVKNSKLAGFPGIIIEHAFIDNSSDVSKYLKSESGLKKLGVADATGIAKAYGLSKTSWVKPALNAASTSADGPKISWKSVKNAKGYAVYRKAGSAGWEMIGTTTSTSYVDEEELNTGSTYYYTVRAYKGSEEDALAHKYDKAYWTSFDSSGVKVVNLAIPVVSKTSTASSGIKVEWEKTSGASGYAVYRKSGSAGWKMIGTSTGSSYTDKSGLKNGIEYQYTLRAYKGSKSTATSHKYDAQYWSYFDTKGMQGDYHSAPSLSSEKASGEGRYISWKAVSGASGYAVYRKVSGGDWAMFDTTTDTSYIDSASLSAGKTYYYTVRAYFGNLETAKQYKYESAYWSHFNGTGLKTVYLGIPELTGTVTASSGIKVTWEKAAGASGYAVYRKAPGKSWGMIGTTTSTSYTDKSGLSNGDSYSYTVRSYKGSISTAKSHKYSAQYWSSFDSKGVSGSYLKTPSLTSEKASAKGAQISWKAVSGASGYAVYRKSSTTGWGMIDTTTETIYIDTNESLIDGASYSYTVRAYIGDVNVAKQNKYDSTYWSHFNSTGLKTVHLDVPELNSATVDGSSTSISWNKVAGASGYAVYRKPADGGWGMIGTTTSTTYVDDSSAGADSSYSYTVRAYKGSVSTAKAHKYSSQYWSGYDNDGVSVPTGNPFVDAFNFIMDWLF